VVNRTVFTIVALVLIGTGIFWYVQYTSNRSAQSLQLSAEAREYITNLKLSEVELKAQESYLKQMAVEIDGKITNAGGRGLRVVEIFCVFHDAYGQLVLRERVPIVSARMGGLRPGETKSFRMPFDVLPESWNHQLPALVIAGIQFQ
jgi:hypothetical protein